MIGSPQLHGPLCASYDFGKWWLGGAWIEHTSRQVAGGWEADVTADS